jgi:hypothetical protein
MSRAVILLLRRGDTRTAVANGAFLRVSGFPLDRNGGVVAQSRQQGWNAMGAGTVGTPTGTPAPSAVARRCIDKLALTVAKLKSWNGVVVTFNPERTMSR